MEPRANISGSIQVTWQSKLLICDLPQKLLREVITIVYQRVISVSSVALAHPWDEYVVNFEFSLGQHDLLGVLGVVDRNGIFEYKGPIHSRIIDIDSTLIRINIASIGELLFTHLNGRMVCAKPDWVGASVHISEIWQVVDVDEDRAGLLVSGLL